MADARQSRRANNKDKTVSVHSITTEAAGQNVGEDVPPSRLPAGCQLKLCPNETSVLIGRNGRGQWIARERNGLYGGLFISRQNAVRYALFENGHRPEAIIMVAGILELDISAAPAPEHQVQLSQSKAA